MIKKAVLMLKMLYWIFLALAVSFFDTAQLLILRINQPRQSKFVSALSDFFYEVIAYSDSVIDSKSLLAAVTLPIIWVSG